MIYVRFEALSMKAVYKEFPSHKSWEFIIVGQAFDGDYVLHPPLCNTDVLAEEDGEHDPHKQLGVQE